jgi:L-fuculose-phosphate aldolase
MSDKSEQMARDGVVAAYRRACALGLNEMASGNISVRFGTGMLISPTGCTAESIAADNVVPVNAQGDWTGAHAPSTEWHMHAAIYRDYPDAQAVVHTHGDYSVAVSCHQRPLPGFHYLIAMFGGTDVPCTPYTTPGTPELGELASAALKDRLACLLGSHGMICRGKSLDHALSLAQRLEIMCRQYVFACTIGKPVILSDAEWAAFYAHPLAKNYRY